MSNGRPHIVATHYGRLDHAGTGAWVPLTSASFMNETVDTGTVLPAGLRPLFYLVRNLGPGDAYLQFTGASAAATTNRCRVGPGEEMRREVNGVPSLGVAIQAPVGTDVELYAEYIGPNA